VNGTIDASKNRKTKADRQKSLRKKVHEHGKSASHCEAYNVIVTAEQKTLEKAVEHQESGYMETTSTVFRTAYYLAKQNRPFVDHPELLDLQRLNGVDVGRVLHSNVVCADIIDHIAD
jgi:hypothetical protein